MLSNNPLDFVSGIIRQYSLRLRRIIVIGPEKPQWGVANYVNIYMDFRLRHAEKIWNKIKHDNRWYWICVWGKLGQGNHVNYRDPIEKPPAFSNLDGLKSVFEKLRFVTD